MNDKDEVVIKIKEAYLRLDEIKDKFKEEKKKLENELSQLMGFEKSISRWLEDKYDRVIFDLKKDNGDSEEELNRLKQIFNTYSEANKNQFVLRRKAIENNVEDLYVHYRETVRVQEMQIEDLQNKFRKLNAEDQSEEKQMFRFSDEVERTMNQIYNHLPDGINQALGTIAKIIDKQLVRLVYAPLIINLKNRYLEEYNSALSKIGEKANQEIRKINSEIDEEIKGQFSKAITQSIEHENEKWLRL